MYQKTVPPPNEEAVSKRKPGIPTEISTLSASELQNLVHELYFRQEYLESRIREVGLFRDKYLDLYDSAPIGYLTVSKGCKILEANLTAAGLLGMGRDELIGQSMYSLIPEEQKDLFFEHLMAVFRIQTATTCELKLKKADGIEFFAELRSLAEKSVNERYDRFKIILSNVTERRKSEILQRKLKDNLESLWNLSRKQDNDLKVLADHVLEEIKKISESRYAFYGFINEEETEMEIHSWSREAMNQCRIVDKIERFPISKSGIWGDAVRKRQSIIVNNYNEDHEAKVGLPEGHVELTRLVSVPVFNRGKIVAIGAVANKASEYTEDDVKQLEAFLSHAQIISDQIRLQNALGKSETKFRTIADFTHDWEYWINPDGALVYVSPSCEKVTGYKPEEFINAPRLLLKIVHDEDLSLVDKQLTSVDSGPPLQCEFRIVTRQGRTRWIGQVSQSVYDHDGSWLGRRVSNRDITKRKLAELELRASEEKFSKAYLLNPDSMSITTLADGKFVSVNEGFTRIMGFEEGEVIGKTSAQLNLWADPEDRQKISEALQKEGKIYDLETRVRTRNGDIRYGVISCSIIDLNGEPHILSIGKDITDRKTAEDALRTSQDRWQFALEGARDGVWEYNLATNEVFYSRQWKAMLGYEDHEIGNTIDEWLKRLHPEDLNRLSAIKDKFVTPDSAPYEAEFRMLCKDGTYKWILSRGKATGWTDDGRPSRFIGTHADINSRKLMEEALRERERERSTLINNLPGFVYRCANDRDWTMDYISHGCEEVTGYAPDDFIGNKSLSYNDIVDPDYREPLWEKWQEILTHNAVFEEEYPIINRGGETRWVWERGRGIFSDDGCLLFLEGFITDITGRKKIQEDLRESHENFRTFFESIDDVIVVASPDGKIMYSNSALTRKLGYTPEELREMDVLDLNSKSHRQEAETIFSEMFAGNRTSCPLPLERKGGTLLPSETRVWFGKWSGVDAIFGICKDVSKEQETLQRFDRLFEFNPNPLAVSSTEDGRFVEVNEAFLSTLGFSRDEVIGKTSEELDLFTDPEAQKEVATRLEASGVIRNIELQLKKKNGEIVEGLFSGTVIVIQGQKYLLTTMLDITEHKQAREALKQSESNLRSFFQTIPESVFIMKPDGEILAANETFAYRLGKNPEDVIGHCVFDFLEPDAAIRRRAWIDKMIVSGKPMMIEDERQNTILVHNLYPIFNSEGAVDRLAIYANDITEARRSEKALTESEAQFRRFVETSNEGIWAMDGDYQTTFVNQRMADMLGYRIEEMLGKSVDYFFFDEDLTEHRKNMELRRQGGDQSYERRFRRKDGSTLWTIVSATALKDDRGNFAGSFAMFTDITDKKRAEETLREKEQRYRLLAENTVDVIWQMDPDFRFTYVNQAIHKATGYTRDEWIGSSLSDYCDEETFNKMVQAGSGLVSQGIEGPGAVFEALMLKKDGQPFWAEIHARALFDDDLLPIGFQGVSRDITERLRAEEALRESEKRYRAVVDNLQIGISVINRQMEVVAINPFFGSSYPDVRPDTGQICYSVYNDPPRSSPCPYCPCLHTFQDGKVHESETETPSGNQTRNFRIISCPVKDEYGEVQLVIELVEDVTERRSLRSQLNQAQKMEAVGTLAGGVAHDFNNILQVIMGYSELIQDDERLPEVFKSDFIKINDAAKRGAELVRRLLVFSRKTDFKPQPLDLNRRISDLRKMLERTITKMIKIKLVLSDSLLRLNADPIQIDQVLMNLAVNARDAMPDGGELTFKTANIFIDADMARLQSDAHIGPYVLLTVTDNGSGMSKETMSHMFEPFFTTKSSGTGTGLGLSVVHGIVKQHEGFIICKSEQGRGTRFNIYFPAIDSDVEIEEPRTQVPAIGCLETILLVDDDDVVRGLCQQILEKANYKVIVATNGQEALALYNQRKDEISLVLLDVIMPVMGGRRCLEELLALNPSLKVIIISGYQAETSANDLVSAGAKAAIYKPFRPNKVLEVIGDVLGKQA